MSKHLIASYNGIQEYQHIDPMRPDDLIIETVQDCAPILEHVKQLRDGPIGKEWKHVAEVPMYFFDKWAKEGSLHDKPRLRRWLDDPANAMFRVWSGRMGQTSRG